MLPVSNGGIGFNCQRFDFVEQIGNVTGHIFLAQFAQHLVNGIENNERVFDAAYAFENLGQEQGKIASEPAQVPDVEIIFFDRDLVFICQCSQTLGEIWRKQFKIEMNLARGWFGNGQATMFRLPH